MTERKGLIAIMQREWRVLSSRALFLFCMVVAPLFCLFFFTSIMGDGLPKDLPAGLVDADNSSLSRSLGRNLNAMGQTEITERYSTVRDARKAVQRGEIYGFFYIPDGFSQEVQSQRQPKISFYSNYSYMIAGSLLFRDMKMMSELSAGSATRSQLYAKGMSDEQAMAWLQPIALDTHPIGNPWLNYSIYLSNILIPGVLGLLIFMVTVCSLGLELKQKRSLEWLEMASGDMLRAVVGKLLPHTIIFALVGLFIDIYLYAYLDYPLNGGFGAMYLLMLLFIFASQGLGLLMFTALPTLRLGLSFASLWGMISFSICGASFPLMGMPTIIQWASYLFPLRHYYLTYVTSALDGFSLYYARENMLYLVAFAVVPLLLLPRLKSIMQTHKYKP